MTIRTKLGSGALAALLAGFLYLLTAAPGALALQSDQYDAFTACPTDEPALNDPASETAICVAGSAPGGTLQIGDRTIPLSRFGLQFATLGIGQEDPECPQPGFCFGRVPGTTTVESRPSRVTVHPGRGKGDRESKGEGKAQRLEITIEAAGDVRAVSPGGILGLPVPLFKLPVKLHVEAPWLGRRCYVGSNSNPILLTPFVVGAPGSFGITPDPNGLPVETILVSDLPVADQSLAIPAAQGCGTGSQSSPKADADNDLVNDLLGLPSPAPQNQFALPQVDLAFVGAGFDGTPPDGGALIQAAFDAAK